MNEMEKIPAEKDGVVVRSFDYSTLEPQAAKTAREAVAFIGERHRSATNAISEIGDRLIAVKDSLPHGQFSEWLDAEFGWSDKTARNYMAVARTLPKTETVSVLPLTVQYKLAHASEPVRANVLKAMEARHIPAEAVSDLVDEEREKDKAAKAEAAKSPEMKAKERARKERQDREHERHRAKLEEERKVQQRVNYELAVLLIDRFQDGLEPLINAFDKAGYPQLARLLTCPYGYTYVGAQPVPNERPADWD